MSLQTEGGGVTTISMHDRVQLELTIMLLLGGGNGRDIRGTTGLNREEVVWSAHALLPSQAAVVGFVDRRLRAMWSKQVKRENAKANATWVG